MNMINIDARHLLSAEKEKRFNSDVKKFAVTTLLLCAGLIVATLVVQHFNALNSFCAMGC